MTNGIHDTKASVRMISGKHNNFDWAFIYISLI